MSEISLGELEKVLQGLIWLAPRSTVKEAVKRLVAGLTK